MNKLIVYIKRFTVCCGLLFIFLLNSYAQRDTIGDKCSQSMVLYFRFDRAIVDKGYMGNSETLRHLDEVLSDSALTHRIDSIRILSFSSPEGDRSYNERLTRKRSVAVKGYLVWKYPHLDQHRIHLRPQGENWQELRRMIVADEKLPNRDKVLQIMDHTPDVDRCKKLLRQLDGGNSYRYIRDHLLRYLRNAAVCMVWLQPDRPDTLSTSVTEKDRLVKQAEQEQRRQEQLRQQEQEQQEQEQLHRQEQLQEQQKQQQQQQQQSNAPLLKEKRPFFALKTNLLFDAALMPNIELEVPIGKRWSVNAEYMFPWWLFDGDKYSMQILMGGLEGRYWLGSHKKRENSEVLTGHFLGLYAGGGKYDLQWEYNGYQGEFFIAAGISYGWATRIARNLHLELNIGIGLLRTDYRHYHARDNYQTLLWQENGKYTWFGPTKAKISFVWLLNRKVKAGKGGVR